MEKEEVKEGRGGILTPPCAEAGQRGGAVEVGRKAVMSDRGVDQLDRRKLQRAFASQVDDGAEGAGERADERRPICRLVRGASKED